MNSSKLTPVSATVPMQQAEESFVCLYCWTNRPANEATQEHGVPQFLGGASAPLPFHLRNVCATCNRNLGLFVDASYVKDWAVTNTMAEMARRLCAGIDDPGLPLVCVGNASIAGISVPDGHVCELWIGPSGERILWLRRHDARMNAYVGGNPIDSKSKPTVVYYGPTATDASFVGNAQLPSRI